MAGRRGLLLLPLLAACGSDEEPVTAQPLAPIDYKYLTPLPLNVANVEVAPITPSPPPGDVGDRLSPTPAEAVRAMARDRLIPVGKEGMAKFAVTRSAMVRNGDALTCQLACRLEIFDGEGEGRGYVEAQSRRARSGSEATRAQSDAALLRETMDALNVEFEFQLRRVLKKWLAAVPPPAEGGGAIPAPVEQETLPKT